MLWLNYPSEHASLLYNHAAKEESKAATHFLLIIMNDNSNKKPTISNADNVSWCHVTSSTSVSLPRLKLVSMCTLA